MASSGPKYPTTVTTVAVDPEDDTDWSYPGNVSSDDGVYAYVDEPVDVGIWRYSYRLKAQNFGFAIPAGAIINGIAVEIEKMESHSWLDAFDYRVQLLDAGGALVGNNKALGTEWPTAWTVFTYGGATDTWAASPTAGMVNDPDFGVVLSLKYWAYDGTYEARVDFIRITIYYTAAQTYDETGKLQVILNVQNSVDNAIRNETNRLQTILGVQTESDIQTMQEVGRLQIILAAQSKTDIQTMQELNKLQLLAAIQTEKDGWLYSEINRLQTILAVLSKTDGLLCNETGRLQIILATLGEMDGWLYNELGRLQVILSILGISESLVSLRQVLAAPSGRELVTSPVGRSLVAPPSGRNIEYP